MLTRLLLITFSLVPQIVFAQTPELNSTREIVSRFGLLGHWANDCHSPAAPGNWHIYYSIRKSGEVMRHMHQPDKIKLSTLVAKEIDSNTLAIHEIYGKGWGLNKGTTKDYRLRFAEDHSTYQYQSIMSVYNNSKNSFIKDSKMTNTRKPSSILEKCS